MLATVRQMMTSIYGQTSQDMPDLAPAIFRQRLVIEGRCSAPIDDRQLRDYLSELSEVCGMHRLIEPVTHCSDRYGWAGWVHWETSGAHVYAWERPVLFFSVDIYTCKAFEPSSVVEFTERLFGAHQIVAREF